MKFRKKPVVIEASRWLKNGDHPDDHRTKDLVLPDGSISEGQVVRYFRHPAPDKAGHVECGYCGVRMHDHGWIDTMEGGHVVCPGDWIITGVKGERYPCKPDVFEATYERVV